MKERPQQVLDKMFEKVAALPDEGARQAAYKALGARLGALASRRQVAFDDAAYYAGFDSAADARDSSVDGKAPLPAHRAPTRDERGLARAWDNQEHTATFLMGAARARREDAKIRIAQAEARYTR